MSKTEIIENIEVEEKNNIDEMNLMHRILCVINEIRLQKHGKNTFSNYDYFTPETINSKVNPLLLKYKVFPRFYTTLEKIETETSEHLENNGTKIVTQYEYKEVAKLEFIDVLKRDELIQYSMPIQKISIKGANEMQNIGGVRTYAKRYLYMEALNISDDTLDLDSDNMQNKTKGKPASKDEKVSEKIAEIQIRVESLRKAGLKDADIAKVIKSVYTDNGQPSANYKACQTVEEANKIIVALSKM